MKNTKWIFFDVGTTLVDEEKVYNHRLYEMIKETNITFEKFDEKRIELSKKGLDGNSEAIKYFNLKKTPWHLEDEFLYDDTIEVLEYLMNKGYKLGIIANQKSGLKNRLDAFGILKYFDVVIASEEVGFSKPNIEIFKIAFNQTSSMPKESVMIGDRLDNDIIPAKQIGMQTIWIRQGLAKYQEIKLGKTYSDWIINTLSEIKNIL